MKKLILTVLVSLFLTLPAMAAWTVTAQYCDGSPYAWGPDTYMYCYQLNVLSDASSSGDMSLSSLLATQYGAQEASRLMRQIQGNGLYWVDYQPGAATPTTASTITIDKETTALIFTQTVGIAGTAEGWPGDSNTAKMVPITNVVVAMTTLADATNAIIKLWFYGGKK